MSWNKEKIIGMVMLCVTMLAGCAVPDRALVLQKDAEAGGAEGISENISENMVEAVSACATVDDEGGQDAAHVPEVPAIKVHVCGAVVSPGVVEVPYGSRVVDALEAAGGLQENASTDFVNLAAKLEDAGQIYFPTREEAEQKRRAEEAAASGLVNINTAGTEQLCTLPGIGEARAADIIAFRQTNGAFSSKEAIMQVPGIKQSAYDKLETYITVD